MGVFRNEYGDVVAWRIAIAVVLLVAIAVVVAVVAFGPRAGENEDDGHVDLPAPADAQAPDAGIDGWLADIEGADALSALEGVELVGLMRATEAWEGAHAIAAARLAIVDAARGDDGTATVRMRVEHEDGKTWLEATLPTGGAWQVTEHSEGFGPATGEHVSMSDEGTLAKVVDPAVASEVSRQLLASGIDGADRAWTTPESVAKEGDVTRMTIWFPREGAEPEAWDATYDVPFGMLEIQPATQGAGPVAEPGEPS